jgi:hypothetical protein
MSMPKTGCSSNLRFLLCIFFFALVAVQSFALNAAASKRPPISEEHLKGITKIAYSIIIDHRSYKYLTIPTDKTYNLGEVTRRSIAKAVSKAFLNYPEISAMRADKMSAEEKAQPNVLYMIFSLTAREELAGETPLRAANLSVHFFQSSYYMPKAQIGYPLTTYPFLVPNSLEGFDRKLSEAAYLLIGYVPNSIACANGSNPPPCNYDPFRE